MSGNGQRGLVRCSEELRSVISWVKSDEYVKINEQKRIRVDR